MRDRVAKPAGLTMLTCALACAAVESRAFAQAISRSSRTYPNAQPDDQVYAPLTRHALMHHVRVLADPSFGGRAAGSRGEHRAARYVAQVLGASGLRAERQFFEGGTSQNVYALLEGRRTDEFVVLGAHIDHLGTKNGILYPGAEDNASGVAVVLEVARALSRDRRKLGRSVLFVLFGSEEPGMLGSKAFVEEPPVPLERMLVMVNIDMIGRPLADQPLLGPLKFLLQIQARSLGLSGVRARPRLRAILDSAAAARDIELVAAEDLPSPVDEEVDRQARGRGDSVSFERAGVPAAFLGSGESSDYHQPSDLPDRIDEGIIEQRANAVYEIMLALSNAEKDEFSAARKTRPFAPKRRPKSGWYLPVGVGTGLALHEAKSGAYLGVEASAVHFSNETRFWIGGFGDTLYDFSNDRTRFGFGPELGLGPVGIDGGFLGELTGSRRRVGFEVRPVLTLSVIALSGRIAHLVDAGSTETFGELGVVLKLPFFLCE